MPLPRRLLRLHAPDDDALRALAATHPPTADRPWLGGDRGDARHAQALLGLEFDGVVIDARTALDANRLCALLGAVRGGGEVLWLSAARPPDRFGERCEALLGRSGAQPLTAPPPAPAAPASRKTTDDNREQDARAPASTPTDAQLRVLPQLTDRLRADGAPVALLAARGRGKSAALGFAIRAIASADARPARVTAPRRSAADVLLRHAALPGLPTPEFVPVERALAEPQPERPLLVDEAAALSVDALLRLAETHPRLLCATTTQGYEGTGQAFRLNVLPALRRRWPATTLLTLEDAIRFEANDAVERFLQALLAQDAAEGEALALPDDDVQAVDGERLLRDEPLLAASQRLLALAHYQSRPSDLARMLDDPGTRTWCLARGGRLVACALTVSEGGLDDGLARAVVAGQRRPRGQLGAGVLAERLGRIDGARLRSERVSRIAVAPQARRAGLGRTLLDAIARRAAAEGASLLTSSFGAREDVLAFWRACGLRLLRLGDRPERSTGAVAAFVARALDAPGAALLDGLQSPRESG